MNDLRTKQKCSFYQSKVKKERAVLLPPHALQAFNRIREDIDLVYKDHDVLFPGEPYDKDESHSKKTNNVLNTRKPKWPHKFPEMINRYLEPYAQKFNLKLTSHSFRINFVTDLLRHEVPTHVAQELVGHSDIRSTLCYKRYTTTDEDKLKNLSKPHAAREAAKKIQEEAVKAVKAAKKAQRKTKNT